ncbi:MAG: Gfo/Idh/MocA family oxidoreductase [Gemmatimonadota bacterium]
MDRNVRVGIIGAGSAAQAVHLPILMRLPDVEVVGIVDPARSKVTTIAERYGIPGVALSLTDLLADTRLDAVLVCSPTSTHESIVLEALGAGLHVLCERPLCPTVDAADRLIETAASANRQLMVAMNHRYSFDLRSIQQFVRSGELGKPFFVHTAWHNRRQKRPRRGWRRDASSPGAGVMMDVGVPALDAALWILGYPQVERVSARFHPAPSEAEVEASAFGLLQLEGGLTISFDVTWELQDESDHHALQLLAAEGTASSLPFRISRRMETGLTDVTPPLERSRSAIYTDSYRQEWADFLRYVRGDKPVESPDEQRALMRITAACYTSAREGREVEL